MALSTTFMQCALKTTRFGIITQNKAISPFKVTDFGTNQKLIYDFLSVINILPAILHHLRNIAFEMSIKMYSKKSAATAGSNPCANK